MSSRLRWLAATYIALAIGGACSLGYYHAYLGFNRNGEPAYLMFAILPTVVFAAVTWVVTSYFTQDVVSQATCISAVIFVAASYGLCHVGLPAAARRSSVDVGMTFLEIAVLQGILGILLTIMSVVVGFRSRDDDPPARL